MAHFPSQTEAPAEPTKPESVFWMWKNENIQGRQKPFFLILCSSESKVSQRTPYGDLLLTNITIKLRDTS